MLFFYYCKTPFGCFCCCCSKARKINVCVWVISLHRAHRRRKLASCFGPKPGEKCPCVCVCVCVCFHPVWAQHCGIFNFCRFIEKNSKISPHGSSYCAAICNLSESLHEYITCLLLRPLGFKKQPFWHLLQIIFWQIRSHLDNSCHQFLSNMWTSPTWLLKVFCWKNKPHKQTEGKLQVDKLGNSSDLADV